MDRAGFAVLMVLTVALVSISDSQKDTTGGRKEGAGVGQEVWVQEHSARRQKRPGDGALSSLPGDTSPRSSHSGVLVRLPRATPSHGDDRHISSAVAVHSAGASREDLVSAPRDVALRTARHPANQQHRTKVNRRQSSKPGSGSTRRLVG